MIVREPDTLSVPAGCSGRARRNAPCGSARPPASASRRLAPLSSCTRHVCRCRPRYDDLLRAQSLLGLPWTTQSCGPIPVIT